jgi:ParB-like chromosome segregation protein Spo0J
MVRKLGTGTVINEENTRKWVTGVKHQMANTARQQNINVRYVPLSHIILDPDNPRQLDVTPEQVVTTNRLIPIQKTWIDNDHDNDRDWWDAFATAIGQHLSGKALSDYLDLVLLALSVKSHDRLLNPITTYTDTNSSELKLIAGERRYLAHLILNETVIATRVLDHRPDQLEKDILQWEENNQRLNLSLYEQLVNLKRLLQGWEQQHQTKLSVRQMVVLAGVPRMTAHRYLSVIRSSNTQLLEAIRSNQVTSLRQAADLASLSDTEIETMLQRPQAKQPPPLLKIKRMKDYTPIQKILQVAADHLGSKQLVNAIGELDLNSAEGVANGFEMLANHVAKTSPTEQ